MDLTKLTPEEKAELDQEILDAHPEYTKEQLIAMQQDRIWGTLEGSRVYPPGVTPPPIEKPVHREHPWEKKVSDQFGEPQR